MEILENFGVQPTLLFGQIVNFLIILFLLRKFFFGKITSALDDRKKRIEESLKNADLIERRLAETEEKSRKIIDDAQASAQKLLTDAKTEAQSIASNAADEARKTIDLALISAKQEIETEREKMKSQLQEETMILVTHVVQKVLGRNLKPAEKQELTKQSITQISKKVQ